MLRQRTIEEPIGVVERERGRGCGQGWFFIFFKFSFSRTLLWDCKQLQPRCGWFYQKWTTFPHGKQSKEQRIPLTAAAAPQQLVAHHSTSSVLIQSRLCLCASQPSTGGSPVLLGGCCRGGGSSALRQQQQVTAGGWLWSSRVAGSLFRTPSPAAAAPGVESPHYSVQVLVCPSLIGHSNQQPFGRWQRPPPSLPSKAGTVKAPVCKNSLSQHSQTIMSLFKLTVNFQKQ